MRYIQLTLYQEGNFVRHLLIIAACAFSALTGCAQKSDPAPEKVTRIVTPAQEDTSKHHSINGYIIGAPAGSDIELTIVNAQVTACSAALRSKPKHSKRPSI